MSASPRPRSSADSRVTSCLRSTLGAIVIAVSACLGSLGGRTPAIELYRLAWAAAATDSNGEMQPALLDGVIGVERYETPGIYNGRGIVYRVDEVRYGVYPTREWAFPLGEMLGRLSVDRLGQRSVARAGAVYEPSVRRRAEYAWRGTVREFEEVNRGNRVLAAVHLEARLIRSSDGTPVWSGSRRLEREIPQPTMPAIVDALSELASQAVTELADSARLAISDGKTTGSTPRE